MSILTIAEYLQSLTEFAVYPLAFPNKSKTDAILVRFEPSQKASRAGTVYANLQLIVRSSHPSLAEAEANRLLEYFDNKTRFKIEAMEVVLATARQPFSMFLEKDDRDRYKYNVNIALLIDKGGKTNE